MVGKDDDQPTGSVASAKAEKPGAPTDGDLASAGRAVLDVLGGGHKDASAPWENPQTGSRGMVTPLASTYTQDGFECRDFLASFVNEAAQSWMQGAACRVHHGRWIVRSIKPLNKA